MKDLIARALVGLPFGDQAAETVVEQLLVDDNIVRHDDGRVEVAPSDKATVVGGGGEIKAQ